MQKKKTKMAKGEQQLYRGPGCYSVLTGTIPATITL